MAGTHFEKQGTLLTVKPEGRLDFATSPVLEKEMQPYLDDVQKIIMDFQNVEYVSSAGLRVLLAVDQALENRGGSMKLIHVNQHIIDIFNLVGFMEMVEVERE